MAASLPLYHGFDQSNTDRQTLLCIEGQAHIFGNLDFLILMCLNGNCFSWVNSSRVELSPRDREREREREVRCP